MRSRSLLFAAIFLLSLVSVKYLRCQRGGSTSFSEKSTAFVENSAIPKKYTCDGPDVSPALEWSAAPAGRNRWP